MEVEELNKYSQVSVGVWMQHVSNKFLYLKNNELKNIECQWMIYFLYLLESST